MKKMLLAVAFVAGSFGIGFALDTDARWSSTGTDDVVGVWCRGVDADNTAYQMRDGLYFNCTTGEVTLGQGIPTASIDNSAITSPKLASTAVSSGKFQGMGGASASGKLLCGKANGDIGSCTTASSAVGTVCDICN